MKKVLIQIGCANGNDEVTSYLLEGLYDSFLIEPNPNNFQHLVENYKHIKNATFDNIAINTEDKKITIFYESNAEVSFHGSANYQHLIRHGHHSNNIKSFEVDSITIDTLIKKHNLQDREIEFLFIDTEGLDCDILLSTDFSKYNINNICFEHIHCDGIHTVGPKYQQVKKYLNSLGFKQNLDKNNVAYSTWMTKS